MKKPDEKEVLIPDEVLPPEQGQAGDSWGKKKNTRKRAERAFGPIVAGAIIDAVDFVTMGIPGLIIGGVAMFWICSIYKLPLWQRLLWSLGAGYYCAIPHFRFIPLGTLIGAYVQFTESRDK